jgi:putative transposase
MVKRLNTATLDELQNVICCSNYRRDYMSEINMYKWEDIRKYFPPERVAEIRAKILELRKSGKYTDRELWEMYGMSERTFYDLVERAKDGSTAEDLKDRPSKPKNPYRKLTDEDKAEIINLRLDDTNRIESSKLAFFDSMEKTDHVLKPEKVQRLTGLMDKAMKGVRRIAASFNRKKENKESSVRVGKSWIHHILAIVGLTGKQKTAIDSKHLQRSQEPLSSFNMDYTQRRIGSGEIAYAFGVLDIFNSGIVILDAHKTKSGANVVESLHQLRKMVPKDVVIEIRSDGGLEFNNVTVREYCNKNNIILHILPKAHPWLNAFIERAIETLQYEFINLQYHATFNDFQNFLVIAKNGYNLREHSSFNYRSPVEIWNSSGVLLSVTAGGLWT